MLNNEAYDIRLNKLRKAIQEAQHIIIGAGAGLSAAAGLEYSGKRFDDNFVDFIKEYGFTDMYTSSFHEFDSEEERWAYWAQHININRFAEPAAQLYKDLLQLVADKDYFVVTTNVDAQFEKSGFDINRIFAVQGDYGYLQCATGCHDKLYPNHDIVINMVQHTLKRKIPTALVPHCPVCGGPMDVNIRKNQYFVQDAHWNESCNKYQSFVHRALRHKTILLEFGVGFNTPGIIRFPFDAIASQHDNVTLARINRDYPTTQSAIINYIPFSEDANLLIASLLQ